MVFFVGLRGGEYELIGEDSRRQRFLRRAYGAVALALGCFFVLYVAGDAVEAHKSRREVLQASSSSSSSSSARTPCRPSGAGTVVCRYGGEAFLEIDAVRAYFESVGVSTEAALRTYLPSDYTVTFSKALMGDATGGKVAFSLYLPQFDAPELVAHLEKSGDLYNGVVANGTFASLLVVAAWDGRLLAATVATDHHGPGSTRFDAVKVDDPSTILSYSNVFGSKSGSLNAWDWPTNALRRVNDLEAPTSHDVQVASDGASYWQPVYSSFVRRCAADGAVVAEFDDVCPSGGMNHVQLLDNETRALVSCRYSNAIVLYDLEARAPIWVAGGDDATVAVAGLARPWAGQHNAEMFGDEIYVFDNAYGQETPSRVLRLRVDGPEEASVDWSYDLPFPFPHGYAEFFGDADKLPNGNCLASWWPAKLAPSLGLTADVSFVEIARGGEVAWRMDFSNTGATVGGPCVDDGDVGCERSKNLGWKAYSVERFYDGPVVYDAGLVDGALKFTAHAALKRQRPSPGTWTLLDADDAVLSTGAFDFAKHSLPTKVHLDAPAASARGAFDARRLAVEDEWGQVSYVDCHV